MFDVRVTIHVAATFFSAECYSVPIFPSLVYTQLFVWCEAQQKFKLEKSNENGIHVE